MLYLVYIQCIHTMYTYNIYLHCKIYIRPIHHLKRHENNVTLVKYHCFPGWNSSFPEIQIKIEFDKKERENN